MEWRSSWTDPFQEYLKPFASLIGDRRTWCALLATVKGIIASESVIGERIAASSAELSRSKNGAQRVLRMAKGESTKRSELDAEDLTARLRQVRVAQLQESESEEVWLIADGSDLCKPYAAADGVSDASPRQERACWCRATARSRCWQSRQSGAVFSIKKS